jgi:hypothetical protein
MPSKPPRFNRWLWPSANQSGRPLKYKITQYAESEI